METSKQQNSGSMDVTYANASSISKALPAHSNASSISRRSVSIGINHSEDIGLQESEPRSSNPTTTFSVPNREGKVKQEEQDKGIWNFLKNKLKPKKKEKGNFSSCVESNGRQDQGLCNSINQHKNEPNFSHVTNYDFLRAQCRPFHKETKFRASTIDSRRLHTQTVSSQILWRPKREVKLLTAPKTRDYRSNIFYLRDGTAERIDRWLAENEAFMRADEQSTIATAVVGSHRRTSQQTYCQTSKQSGKQDNKLSTSLKTKDIQINGIQQQNNFNSYYGLTSKKPIIAYHLPTNLFRQSSRSANHLPTNLFRQSSRSANHLPVSRIKAEAFPNHQKSRPLSHFECQEMSYNQYVRNLQKSPNSNIVLDNPEIKNTISAVSSTPLKSIESTLNCEQLVKVPSNSNSSGHENFSKVPKFDETNRVKSLESIHINKDATHIPQSRDHSVKSEGSKTQTFSSESLNNLSCNESYCTDYTPYAFGEKFKRPHTNSSCHEPYKRETSFSHESELSVEKIPLPEMQVLSKIQTENNLEIRKFVSKDGSQFYHTPKVAKFVTTIYLTGDEFNPDMTNNNPGNIFVEKHEQNAINLNKIPSIHCNQPFDRRIKTLAKRYLENVAHESSKFEINSHEFISIGKLTPSDVPMIAQKGTEIHATTETAMPSKKCAIETLKTDKLDLHLDIDIFDLKTNNKKEGNDLWKHSPIGDGDTGKYEDGIKNTQAENTLHINLFESPRDDRKMCCLNKISEIGKSGSPFISNSPIIKDRQVLKNESLYENILSVQQAYPQSSDSMEKKAQLKVITNKSSNSEVSIKESETDLTFQSILEHLSMETNHSPKEKKSDYENDNESLEVFDDTTSQSCAVMGEISQVMKRINSKIPGNERQSPPLNSFTSRSTLSLFEELHFCSESPKNVEYRSSVIPSTPDLPMVGKEADNTETQTYSFEKQISPSNDNLQLLDSSDASKNSVEPFLDLRAFMTVKHNDHARIFDLCFGNSPAFNKTSVLAGNDKDLTDWKSVDSLHCKDSTPFYDSTQNQPKKETHISNLHAFNRAGAFFV